MKFSMVLVTGGNRLISKLPKCVAVAMVGLSILLSAGCKAKVEPLPVDDAAAAREAAQKLPEGSAVISALEQKDYQSAIGALAKVQAGVTPELQDHYILLKLHVKNTLIDAAATDPKAEEALNAFRFMTMGR
jgi:hypothetical protein